MFLYYGVWDWAFLAAIVLVHLAGLVVLLIALCAEPDPHESPYTQED